MATAVFLIVAAVAALVSPAVAQNCATHRFTPSVQYSNCTDLPTLSAYLHWNYSAAGPRPTLSVAFTAPLPDSDGWVSWAINPTAPLMAGSQAFIAFEDSNGSFVARTYNISFKGPVTESRISYEVLSKSAVSSSSGLTTIFAVIVYPQTTATVYQVWQVGSSVENGVPQAHRFEPENLRSTGELRLGSSPSNPTPVPGPRQAPGPGGVPANTPPANRAPPPSPSAAHSVAKLGVQAIYAGLVALGVLTLLS